MIFLIFHNSMIGNSETLIKNHVEKTQFPILYNIIPRSKSDFSIV